LSVAEILSAIVLGLIWISIAFNPDIKDKELDFTLDAIAWWFPLIWVTLAIFSLPSELIEIGFWWNSFA
jgi:hypothetical protein